MRRVFQLTALLVLALWVPATMHCGIETLLGCAPESCCSHEAADTGAPADHCALEDGAYRTTNPAVAVAAPALLHCWCGATVCLIAEPAAVALEFAYTESPPGLARTWQFVARAAWPARAPAHVS